MAARRHSSFIPREAPTNSSSGSQYKLSADRHQRQAELSLRLEEKRSIRPSLIKEDEVSTSFLQDFFSRPGTEGITSLTRADTSPSPLEVHPGRRLSKFRRGSLLGNHEIHDKGIFIKPFPEPTVQEEIEIDQQRGAIFKRAWTAPIDAEQAQTRIQRSASNAAQRDGFLARMYNQARHRRAIKPGAFEGIEFAATLAMAHANAVLTQPSEPMDKRKVMYVLEYDFDQNGVFSCARPKNFDRIAGLKQYLEDNKTQSVLRLIYVCNHEEAMNYLSGAYGISGASAEGNERTFRDWMQGDHDIRRASNKAIRWRPAFDIARGTICSAFGIDFGSIIVPHDEEEQSPKPKPNVSRHKSQAAKAEAERILLRESSHRQRVAVYMQRATAAAIPGPRVTRFNTGLGNLSDHTRLDTVIICEYSTGEVGEVIDVASLLALDLQDRTSNRTQISAQVIEDIVLHVIEGLIEIWQSQVALVHEPHAELEDHVYSQPADSSRAMEVWSISQRLHNMLKLVNRHAKVIETVQDDFQYFAERPAQQTWLHHVLDEFGSLADVINSDYLQPLEHMIDLMYKSVTIRDSRQSLELNASLWRLSWITFIFLPLTFLATAFGMNVDSLSDDPSIKWYFIMVVPLVSPPSPKPPYPPTFQIHLPLYHQPFPTFTSFPSSSPEKSSPPHLSTPLIR